MSMNTTGSTQRQRDAINKFRRSYNERHHMEDGEMIIDLYNRFGKCEPESYVTTAHVASDGHCSYARDLG